MDAFKALSAEDKSEFADSIINRKDLDKHEKVMLLEHLDDSKIYKLDFPFEEIAKQPPHVTL